MKSEKIPLSIDEYIAGFPDDVQKKLKELRQTVKKIAPDAKEKISYRMPSFTLNGLLLYFAGHTKHIGLYPYPSAIEAFKGELSIYHTAKGSIRFPNNQPLPMDLITRIIEFRVKEKRGNALAKSIKKPAGARRELNKN
jgi:uncharacterized protein YdhG (YjbR/CyaY superfamily)